MDGNGIANSFYRTIPTKFSYPSKYYTAVKHFLFFRVIFNLSNLLI